MIVVAGGVPVGVLLLLGKGRIGEVATTRTTKKVPVVGWGGEAWRNEKPGRSGVLLQSTEYK